MHKSYIHYGAGYTLNPYMSPTSRPLADPLPSIAMNLRLEDWSNLIWPKTYTDVRCSPFGQF